MSRVEIHAHFPAELGYRVLKRVDLGRDAANIFQRGQGAPPGWAPMLRAAYQEAPGRHAVQFLPLYAGSVETLLTRLHTGRVAGLLGPEGTALSEAFAIAAAAELESARAEWAAQQEERTALLDRRYSEILKTLQGIRIALWAGVLPPPLRILHCPSLGHHGRAMFVRGERVVAVNLRREWPDALIQIVHEECHPVSDPTVADMSERNTSERNTSERKTSERDTRAGTPGHSQHMRLELAAVELGATVLAQAAPELMDAYAIWRRRYRI